MDKLQTAISASIAAGEYLMDNYGKLFEVKNKESHRDVVTEIDRTSEEIVIKKIQESDQYASILSEERGLVGEDSENRWIIDALDGTVNYIHNIPFFAVSISYWKKNNPYIGVIYNPYSKELFYSKKDFGSFCNQTKLKIEKSDIKNSVTAMAFSGKAHNPKMRHKEFEVFGQLNDLSQGCLRTGSAAMNLAYLSSGKFSFVVGKANKLWDVAAGLIIAKEAGADVAFHICEKNNNLIDYQCSSLELKNDEIIDLSYLDMNVSIV
jgi:myo-inositol-1(or 4)-monophosphatase